MVPRICNRQGTRSGVQGNLSREGQDSCVWTIRRCRWPRAFAQRPGRPMLGDQFIDQFLERCAMSLSRHCSYDISCRIDENQSGPGAHAVALPDQEFVVIHDRMSDLVAPDGVAKGDRFPLVGKLCGVDPDDRQSQRESGFQRLQLREDVQAVDSAVRPEVEQDRASAQIREAKRPWGIEPLHALRKLRRVDYRAGTGCHGQPPY